MKGWPISEQSAQFSLRLSVNHWAFWLWPWFYSVVGKWFEGYRKVDVLKVIAPLFELECIASYF
jgi:hypothetical protein